MLICLYTNIPLPLLSVHLIWFILLFTKFNNRNIVLLMLKCTIYVLATYTSHDGPHFMYNVVLESIEKRLLRLSWPLSCIILFFELGDWSTFQKSSPYFATICVQQCSILRSCPSGTLQHCNREERGKKGAGLQPCWCRHPWSQNTIILEVNLLSPRCWITAVSVAGFAGVLCSM